MLRPISRARSRIRPPSHGVFLDVLGMGVLHHRRLAASARASSRWSSISRGSGLIADDVVEFYRIGPETIEGRCPPMLRDLLEVRGLGVLNIRTIFGEAALRPRKNLKLIVHLERPAADVQSRVERLPLRPGAEEIMGVQHQQGDDPGRRRAQPRGADRGRGAQPRAAAARNRQHDANSSRARRSR